MSDALLNFSVTNNDKSMQLIQKRTKLSSHILISIIVNCILLLIFTIIQAIILKRHHDWDAILVFILSLATMLIEGYGLIQLTFMKTKLLLRAIFLVILFELGIIGLSLYQTWDEHIQGDTNLEIISQIVAIILFFINTITKTILFVQLQRVLAQTNKINIIADGLLDRVQYDKYSKSITQ